MLDVYAAHADVRVAILCWRKGYIRVLIGGGTTGVIQVLDTDCHETVSSQYQDLEMLMALDDVELLPNKLICRSREDCVRDLISIWKRPRLHENTCLGFKRNGISISMDGTEDGLVVREMGRLFKELEMDKLRDLIVEDVCTMVEEGFKWTFDNVYALFEEFPKRGAMDEYKEGQEDEGDEPIAGALPHKELENDEVSDISDTDKFALVDAAMELDVIEDKEVVTACSRGGEVEEVALEKAQTLALVDSMLARAGSLKDNAVTQALLAQHRRRVEGHQTYTRCGCERKDECRWLPRRRRRLGQT
jgi:hypothetical protein